MASGGFFPLPSDPKTFHKRCPINPLNSLSVNMHVDDGEGYTQSPHLLKELKALLLKRYNLTDVISPSTGVCGVTQTLNPDRSITLSYSAYLRKFLHRIGMDNVPGALTPSLPGLFDPPTDTTPVDPTPFQAINGAVVFVLPLRPDLQRETRYLCSRNISPTISDKAKQFQMLRYIKDTTELGPTLSSDPAAYPEGVSIYAAADASHACHPDGRSQTAYILGVGKPGGSAPFMSYSCKETSGVSLHPCETEYVALSRCSREVLHRRQLAHDLGWPQCKPSILLEDNQPAINLATAPQVPRKSRHIALHHHFLRWLHSSGQVTIKHQGGNDIAPDGMTKGVSANRFLYSRSLWFHTPRTSLT
jgi:hypothetical protein